MNTPADTTETRRVGRASVPTTAVLDAWSSHAWKQGVQVDTLGRLDVVRVRTRNSVYEVTVVDSGTGEAVVRGGRFFPQHTRAVVLGSSLGGAFLKLRGIYCGFSLELYAMGLRIVTSGVQSVEIVGDGDAGAVQ